MLSIHSKISLIIHFCNTVHSFISIDVFEYWASSLSNIELNNHLREFSRWRENLSHFNCINRFELNLIKSFNWSRPFRSIQLVKWSLKLRQSYVFVNFLSIHNIIVELKVRAKIRKRWYKIYSFIYSFIYMCVLYQGMNYAWKLVI